MQRQVTIGPQFFAKAKSDYSDWTWAIIREFYQNCRDAPGTSRIDISVEKVGDDTVLAVGNNGQPMTEEVLTTKLLALGESGKDCIGTVGGFGKAKEILYFTHKSYTIHSGDFLVTGCGGMYDIGQASHIRGTESRVVIEGDHVAELAQQAKLYLYATQWPKGFVHLTVNGKHEVIKPRFRKGSRRRSFAWGTVYTNRGFQNRLIVRIDGTPMFHSYLSCDGRCVVVELNGMSNKVLQSNRDQLVWEYHRQLQEFVAEVTVDKKSALAKETGPDYTYFSGTRLTVGHQEKTMQDLVTAAYATLQGPKPVDHDEDVIEVAPDGVDTRNGRVHLDEEHSDGQTHNTSAVRSRVGHEFIVKNTTGLQIPDHYRPTSFSAYSAKLVSVWVKCLLVAHELVGQEAEFSVGFVFDENNEAEHDPTPNYGRVFFINPAVVVTQTNSNSRSLKKRWKFNNEGRYMILAAVAHELAHALGYGPHDEGYAGKLTSLMGVFMANKKRFHPCFR